MIRSISFCVLAMMIGTLCGCASKVLPATAHDPISPDLVAVYQKAPAEYELLSKIEIPVGGEVKWDKQAHVAEGFKQMKAKAAAMGANGVLLWAQPGESDLAVTAGDGTTYYQVPVKEGPRRAVVYGIYVVKH